jgi:hypothetical protein
MKRSEVRNHHSNSSQVGLLFSEQSKGLHDRKGGKDHHKVNMQQMRQKQHEAQEKQEKMNNPPEEKMWKMK